jgi:uncharacterized protein YkwD
MPIDLVRGVVMTRPLSRLSFPFVLVVAVAQLAAADEAKEKAKFQSTKDERELIELINKERAKEKLPALKPNSILNKVARAHSANMAKQGKMEHVLDKKTPSDRVLGAGYDYGKISENIAWSDTAKAPLTAIVKGWMDSKTHRVNILSDKVTETGLGIAKNDKGEVYYTQVFARPRKVRKQPKD